MIRTGWERGKLWLSRRRGNVKIIRGGREVTNLEGYKMIEIWNLYVLLESEE